jgi:hypothetical protein
MSGKKIVCRCIAESLMANFTNLVSINDCGRADSPDRADK